MGVNMLSTIIQCIISSDNGVYYIGTPTSTICMLTLIISYNKSRVILYKSHIYTLDRVTRKYRD